MTLDEVVALLKSGQYLKAFCPTGQGGGVDPSCSPEGGGGAAGRGAARSDRSRRAKASHVRMTRGKRAESDKHELTVARAVTGRNLPDNEPFDVIRGSNAIEVKAIIAGRNDKITMHPESLERKVKYARKNKLTSHTVIIDARGSKPVYYYRKGVGSFRLKNMERLSSAADLRTRIK